MTEPRRLDLESEVVRLAEKAKQAGRTPPEPKPEPWYLDADPNEPGWSEKIIEHNRRQDIESRWFATIPRRFSSASAPDLKDESPEMREQLTDWVKNPAGRNLIFLGPVGTGKTHAAVAAARHLHFNRSRFVTFWPVVELLDQLRPGGSDDALEAAMMAPVLILDDLGSEKPTEWTAERLYAVVNRRWMQELPTIATSNLFGSRKSAPKDYDGPTLDEALGPRMFSRLVGSGAVIVRLVGADRRRA